jgi:hypothetical protein
MRQKTSEVVLVQNCERMARSESEKFSKPTPALLEIDEV